MDEKDGNERVFALEQEVKSLTEELSQCQADKEFVWSLWKRLQVANPDLTQAVSLIVEREREKTEAKDRKVLEILQAKDYKIQELEQKVTGQQQEINNLHERRQRGDGELDIMKTELAALRQRQGNTSRELKEWRERSAKAEEEGRRVVSALEEEKRGLEARGAALQADLERAREQQAQHSHRHDHIHATVKELEQELASVKQQVCDAEARVCVLSEQLGSREQELAQKDQCVAQLRRELQDLQALYSQSVEHAGEQAQLIQQLEGLNLDTQRVLRSQEQAHTADTVSYHKLYTELSMTHQALVCNESQLRQREAGLSAQLRERDQQLGERDQQLGERGQQLQEQLQQLQVQLQQQQQQQLQQLQPPPPQPQHSNSTTVYTQTRQTNSQHFEQLHLEQRLEASEGEQDLHRALELRDQTPASQPQPGEAPGGLGNSECPRPKSRQSRGTQDALRQRSRSLSPRSSRRAAAEDEAKIQRLQELLALKTEENEVLQKAHDKRQERLRLLQSHYRSLREQLRQAEEAHGQGRVRSARAEPWQLRQENSDGVWNELAFFKRQNKKLLAEKANLEEELDVLQVQAAMDRTTTQELRLCLEQEYQELVQRVPTQEREVSGAGGGSSSVPSKPSALRLHQSFLRIEQLERRMGSLEEETRRLHQDKQELQEANAALAEARDDLQATVHRLRIQRAALEEATQARAAADRERALGEAQALQAEVEASRREAEEASKEASQARQRALRLRQELGVVRAERDFLRTAATRRRAKGPVAPINRIKVKSVWRRVPSCQHRARLHPTGARGRPERRRASPARDGWEDLSAESEEEYSDSLDNPLPVKSLRKKTTHMVYRCAGVGGSGNENGRASLADLPAEELSLVESSSPGCCCGGRKRCTRKRRHRQKAACVETRPQVLALRQQIRALREGRREAERQAHQHSRALLQLQGQLQTATQKLASSKQLVQKLSTELTGVEQQKKVLEMELEQWRRVQVQLPLNSAPVPATEPQGGPALKQLEAELKQLQTKLKNASNEVTKQLAACRSLKAELSEKDQRLRELQEKLAQAERSMGMKKQLVEDLRTRLKFFQDTEKSLKSQLEEQEKKVRSLSDEASNRKAFVESLKRRLSVAATEKSQCEASNHKLQEDLHKKEQKLQSLQVRVGESEKALAELEDAASRQMHGLAQQSTQALEGAQRKLSLADTQLQQLRTFAQALAREVEREAQVMKVEVRKRRKQRKASIQTEGRLSQSSMVRAQSIAASILNMTERDLVDMLDTDEEAEDGDGEQDWLQHILKLLQQQIPSAELLMDAMLAKMKERKVLTEELATLEAAVSEKA